MIKVWQLGLILVGVMLLGAKAQKDGWLTKIQAMWKPAPTTTGGTGTAG